MKRLKKIQIPFYILLLIIGSVVAACSTKNKKTDEGMDHESMETSGHHDDEAEKGHEHGGGDEHSSHNESSISESGSKTWMPEGNGAELLAKDFHFIVGSTENVTPIVKEESGEKVLSISSDGTPSAFVFHQSYGNVGMAALLNATGFNGSIKLIHHAQNDANYEFVSIDGTTMKLGRVVNGNVKVFDEKSFTTSGWINLRVSAAGSHFKGYVGSKTITHGHGDKMQDGYVGIMVNGTGQLLIKSIEVAKLEDE